MVVEGAYVVRRGRNSAGHQKYQCKRCGRHFVETINTPLYYRHLSEDKVTLIGRMLNEKMGIRAIERVTGIHRDTVMRVARDLAMHAEHVHGLLVKTLSCDSEHEVDEVWTFVQKKKTR